MPRVLAIRAITLTALATLLPALALIAGTPGTADDISASRALGQPNLTAGAPNSVGAGGLDGAYSGNTLAAAIDTSSVPPHIYVVDEGNNRVLGWRDGSGFKDGAPADLVIGQPNFSSNGCNAGTSSGDNHSGGYIGLGPDSLCRPVAAAVDPNGSLYIADKGNNRVLEYNTPFAGDQVAGLSANLVFGQNGSFTSVANDCQVASADSLCGPSGVATDRGGNLYIADASDNRVLEYNAPLATGGGTPGKPGAAGDTTADMVFGHGGDFTAVRASPPSADSLSVPIAVAIDSSDNLYVVDTGNFRVLEYDDPLAPGGGTPGIPDSAGDTTADLALGSCVFDNVANCPDGATVDFLRQPVAVAVDPADNVYVADAARVLEFDNPLAPGGGTPGVRGSAGDATADRVFGQLGNFNHFDCGEAYQGPATADSLCTPASVAVDAAGDLFVADSHESRVLKYDDPVAAGGGTPGTPGSPGDTTADQVLGQVDFIKTAVNMVKPGGLAGEQSVPYYFSPAGVAVDQTSKPNHLYASDPFNNRVLGWNSASGFASGAPADIVIGQPDPYSYLCNGGIAGAAGSEPIVWVNLSATSLCSPTAVAVDPAGNLYVADTFNNRVLEYSKPFSAGRTAGLTAQLVFGQDGSFTSNVSFAPDQVTADTLSVPAGVAVDKSGNVYIADTGAGRVLEYWRPLPARKGNASGPGSSGDTTADAVYGQKDFSSATTENQCGSVAPATLCAPAGVVVDSANIYVADTRDNRVLQYSTAPGFRLGMTRLPQAFIGQCATPGGCSNPTANSLLNPWAVALDANGNLFVADTGFNRVLEYYRPSAQGGTPGIPGSAGDTTADVVFGQGGSFTSSRTDLLGLSGPIIDSTTLSTPSGVALDSAGNLYVADSGNGRVLSFPLRPAAHH